MTAARPIGTLGRVKQKENPTGALKALRDRLYDALLLRRDALFELMDATACGDAAPGLVHASLSPLHRRGHGSLYAALRHGTLVPDRLRVALAERPLAGGLPVYAVDVSVVARCDAEARPERGYYHHASRHSAGKPIVAGWAYSFVAQVGTEHSSWTAVLDAERLQPGERPEAVAVRQIRRLLSLLSLLPSDPAPIFVFDAGYDPAALTRDLVHDHVRVLARIRDNRVFLRPPPSRPPGTVGRPRLHGAEFRCANPATWGEPDRAHAEDDAACGRVDVRCWRNLHGRHTPITGQTSASRPPSVDGWVVRVVLDRTPGQARPPKPLWLWSAGPGDPDPALLWRAYIHRFDLEHTLRFVKQRLGWQGARVRTPVQMDTWTWVVVAAYAQLRLARGMVDDCRLPWERPRPPNKLTPLRVSRGFGALASMLGTPANAPKPCGRGPGRPKGRRSTPATRFPALKAAVARAARAA